MAMVTSLTDQHRAERIASWMADVLVYGENNLTSKDWSRDERVEAWGGLVESLYKYLRNAGDCDLWEQAMGDIDA